MYKKLLFLFCLSSYSLHAGVFDELIVKKKTEIDVNKCSNSAIVNPVISLINRDSQLIKYAEQAGKDSRVQKELDEMQLKLSLGHEQIGIGYHSANLGFRYYRGAHGGRLFVKKHGDVYFVVAKATKKGKDNENKVMRRLERIYEGLKFKGIQGV